jgi:hypothetical protein
MAHNSRFWHPEDEQYPHLSMLTPGECTHQGGGFSFRSSWKDVTLPKAVEWLPVPSHVARADTSVKRGNVFTHSLRRATRTLFSYQGTTDIFFLYRQKVVRRG